MRRQQAAALQRQAATAAARPASACGCRCRQRAARARNSPRPSRLTLSRCGASGLPQAHPCALFMPWRGCLLPARLPTPYSTCLADGLAAPFRFKSQRYFCCLQHAALLTQAPTAAASSESGLGSGKSRYRAEPRGAPAAQRPPPAAGGGAHSRGCAAPRGRRARLVRHTPRCAPGEEGRASDLPLHYIP